MVDGTAEHGDGVAGEFDPIAEEAGADNPAAARRLVADQFGPPETAGPERRQAAVG